MNNEEKILQLLEEMRQENDRRFNQLKATQAEQGKALAKVKATASEIDRRSKRTQVLLETDYADKLQLLFDGHKTIPETLAPKSRVEVLEDDVSFMKTVIKAMSQEIAELKKAQ